MAKAAHKHDHHHHEGPALAHAARETLQKAGERWTDMRAEIFHILSGFDRAVSAYEIADRIGAQRGKRIAANSVYRILDLFVANNLAKRVETANAYVVNSHPGCVHDCMFLICDKCGNVTHVDEDPLAEKVRSAARNNGFAPSRPVIEVRGFCPECQAA